MKTCIHCQQSKPLDAFRKSARMIGGRENGCKDCHNERRRARYQADPSATLSTNRKFKRTCDRYELLGHKRDTPGGTQYVVRRSGFAKPTTLHHSCHVEIIKDTP